MELKDLVGEHVLDAVDFFDMERLIDDCQMIRFRLDGKVYTAVEDSQDGYRSSMKQLTMGKHVMKNVFPAIKVIGKHQSRAEFDDDDSADILKLIDIETGELVLEVGTDADDSYYPSFVASFRPEAMISNRAKKL